MTACSVGTGATLTTRNEGIDNTIQDEIEKLDRIVIDSLKNLDKDTLVGISSPLFTDSTADLDGFLSMINQAIGSASFDYEEKYYCKQQKEGQYTATVSSLSEDDPFFVTVDVDSPEVYVSLMKSDSDIVDYMLTNVYVNEDGDWKLISMYCGEYSLHDMTVVDLYKKAKELDESGHQLPALMYAGLYSNMLRPGPHVQYKIEGEIKEFTNRLYNEVNDRYTFPQKLDRGNEVEIVGIELIVVKDEFVPMIKYITNTSIDNAASSKKEAHDIHAEAMRTYGGLDECFETFLYRAFSEPPTDPSKQYPCYTTVVE